MKNIILGFAIAATTLAACNNGNNETKKAKNDGMQNDTAMAIHHQTIIDTAVTQQATTYPAKEIIASYLQLKNSLTKDNGKEAAAAGNTIAAELAKVDMKSLPKEQVKNYMDVAGDLKEQAEYIGTNGSKIDNQREHFIMLSKDMVNFVKVFGNNGQTLYNDFCPMANNGKGATWISEIKEIKNPYFGGKMPECGLIKETIN